MSTVLVVGASRGIGLEFVRQYRAAGDRVIATARTDEGLQKIAAQGARPLQLDVAAPASIGGLAAQLDGERPDLALYVAGAYSTPGAKEAPAQPDFDRVMRTNVLGAMQAIVQVAPLVEQARGRFVFITSEMGHIAGTHSSFGWVYRASKAALNMAVRAGSYDYSRATLVAMSPGWVRTAMGGPDAPLSAEESVASMRRTIATLNTSHSGAFLDHDGAPFDGW